MNVLKGRHIVVSDLIKFYRKGKCNFSLYSKKKGVRGVGSQWNENDSRDSRRNQNFLKNICNRNVINRLDPISIIENLKYVSDCNVKEDVIKNYIGRVKLLKEQWSLNKIYFILKILVKYDLHDAVLLEKLEHIINNIDVLCGQREDVDPFENIYIVRISYILHSFYHFNSASEQLVEKVINILSRKIDYIIYHNAYFNRFFYKHGWDGKRGISSGEVSACGSSTVPNTSRPNEQLKHIRKKEEGPIEPDRRKKGNEHVRNINFNEIYLIVSTLKNLKYENKKILNKLKFLYYFNCIDVDKVNENDCKYVTLLFHFFYEPSDKYLYNIMKFFLSKHASMMSSVHDFVLVTLTVYYANMGRSTPNGHYNVTGVDNHHDNERSHKLQNVSYPSTDDISSIIEGMYFLPKEEKKNFMSILRCVCERGRAIRENFTDIAYESVLKLLNRKYYVNMTCFEGGKRKIVLNDIADGNKNESCGKSLLTNEPSPLRKNETNDLQSVSELVKICNYSMKKVDTLYYLYLKEYVENFNVETVLNVFKSFIFVYNIRNEKSKNYMNGYLNGRYATFDSDNLNNLINVTTQIITSSSLHRSYSMCSVKELSSILYYVYQISSIFENETFEDMYIKRLQRHVDSVLYTKLKSILGEGERGKSIGEEGGNSNIYVKNNIISVEKKRNSAEKFDVRSSQDESVEEFHLRKSYLREKNESRDSYICENIWQSSNPLFSGNSSASSSRRSGHKNEQFSKNYTMEVFILLFNMYSKKGDNKCILTMLLKILNVYKVEKKNLPSGVFINLLNSFAKLKYRNVTLIDACLHKIKENLQTANFYDYVNLLISLSKLNIFGINLGMYDEAFSANDIVQSNKNFYRKNVNNMFLHVYNDNTTEQKNNIQIVHNLKMILKKIDESISSVSFSPNYKMINIIPNILNSYTILGFDKIHFKNVNKLVECFHDYTFNYFHDHPFHNNWCISTDEMKQKEVGNEYFLKDTVQCVNNPLGKNNNWYFSQRNNVIIKKENVDKELYLPLQSVYQMYIFTVYFIAYVRCFHPFCEQGKKGMNMDDGERHGEGHDEDGEGRWHLFNQYPKSNVFITSKRRVNMKRNCHFDILNILSERSVHILNNVIFFVKYLNNFYKKNSYEKYNLYMKFLPINRERESQNEELVEYVKKCHVQVKRDNSSMYSSSFHRDVFTTLLLMGVNNMECEVPFLDGIYTADIVINNSVCVEINGSNHYYYDDNMKRSDQKIDSLNIIKYYLLSKKYNLILVPYQEWNNLKNMDMKKKYLMEKMKK
ncbi:hypothetical protein, conserved [Plasmodium ovale curtisi]|uniref:RAP domain-containing protein n=1 Tax=Plasmodium ovale curtisi TaxID=864141 RepID=A0A1A8VZN6_PLAOA|nr:hypothetical protein, conserved [Plasmodium ovale curtisi]